MAVNDISPGFVKIFYQVGTSQHVMTLPCVPIAPDPFAIDNQVMKNSGTGVALGVAVTTFLVDIRTYFNTAADFTYAELWSKPTPADDPLFIEVFSIGVSGTSAVATVPYSQVVMTHRTQFGGLHRLYMMSTIQAPNVRSSAPFPAGAAKNISDYMKGVNGWIVGRDGGKLVAPITFTSKTNDALRKRGLNI